MRPVMRGSRWFRIGLACLLVATVPRAASAESVTLMWDASADPDVLGYIVYVGTESGSYAYNYDVGNATWFVFDAAVAGQEYFFAVASYWAGPVIGLPSPEVSGFANAPPSLQHPGDQTSLVGEPAALQLVGSDPDGDPVSYSATGLPPGMALMESTGFISGSATTVGTYAVTATVSDGVLSDSQTFTWTTVAPAVTDTSPPIVEILSPTTDGRYTTDDSYIVLAGKAYDDDEVVEVTWSSHRGSTGEASGTSGWIAAVPLQQGANAITVTARDRAGNTGTAEITVHSKKASPGRSK